MTVLWGLTLSFYIVNPHEFYIAAKEGEASATGHGVDFYIAAKEQGKRVVRHGVKF